MPNHRKFYAFAVFGWMLLFFGLGWVSLDYLLPVDIPNLTWLGVGITTTGLVIIIATIRTIKNIVLTFDEVEG